MNGDTEKLLKQLWKINPAKVMRLFFKFGGKLTPTKTPLSDYYEKKKL